MKSLSLIGTALPLLSGAEERSEPPTVKSPKGMMMASPLALASVTAVTKFPKARILSMAALTFRAFCLSASVLAKVSRKPMIGLPLSSTSLARSENLAIPMSTSVVRTPRMSASVESAPT